VTGILTASFMVHFPGLSATAPPAGGDWIGSWNNP
jgi:hypothetical protein